MSISRRNALLPALALSVASTVVPQLTQAAQHPTDVEAAIDARERAFEACIDKRDAVCVVNGFYVSDANKPISSPSGGHPPVRGRAELIKMFEGALHDIRAIKLQRVEVIRHGDLADELGLAHITLQSGQTTTGRFSVLWMRESDGWRAKLDFVADDGWKE